MRKVLLLGAFIVALGATWIGGAAGAAANSLLQPPPGSVFNAPAGYKLPDAKAAPASVPAPHGSLSHLLWGYEASAESKLTAYTFEPYSVVASCVPSGPNIPPGSNGRGVAFDPVDGNLWISRLTFFTGDGQIHKVSPPNVTPGTCPEITTLTVHAKQGQPIQPDYGALDVDNKSGHIWAAGYFPVSVGGSAPRNYFYEINRNNGLILQSCYIPVFSDGFNDSLTVMKNTKLPGSSQYLVTDGGEFFDTTIKVIDQASCHKGNEATVVATTNVDHGVTGIDFEWPGLLNTDLFELFNNGNFSTPIWGPATPLGPASGQTEDISLCGYSATFGGGGSDHCPY